MTILQLLIPVALMFILCVMRSIIQQKDEASKDLYALKKPFYPLIFKNDSSPDYKQTTDNQKSFMNFFEYPSKYVLFDAALDSFSGPSFFNPKDCSLEASFVDPKVEAPIIAIVGQYNDVQDIVYQTLNNLQQEWSKKGINNLYLRNFTSETDLFNYIKSDQYLQPNPGVCFGFQITEASNSSYSVNLYFNDQVLFGGKSAAGTIPTDDPVWSIGISEPFVKSFQSTTKDGFAFIQNIIANAILQSSVQNSNASISTLIIPMTTQPFVVDLFSPLLRILCPTLILVMFSLPVSNVVFLIVKEKESKTRETMRIMGLNELPYWASWFVYYTIIITVMTFVAWCVLISNVIVTSGRWQLFLFIWMFGVSIFGEIVFMSSFFSKSKYAGIISALFYIGIGNLNDPVMSNVTPKSMKLLFSLVPQVALFESCSVFTKFYESSVGMDRRTAHTEFDNFVFDQGIKMFIAGFIFFLLIGLYFDAILPREYGTRRHPCYFLQPSTYLGCCKRRTSQKEDENEQRRRCTLPEFQLPSNLMELRNLNPDNYEPVSADCNRLGELGQCLIIDNLEKTYDNGFKAVQGLNIKIFQNQIFAFLGQNGAGKSTTISILTGLIKSSSGKATAFNFDMFNEPERVRNFMGICPQHDVLFDFLTPLEHLYFFYELKCGKIELKHKEIDELIRDVGLTLDKDKPSGQLSGGNKRKLSVAISLCGGSKLILLDEPTAGMDLGARRALWDMLKNYRRDKIIILTTHYMDEADILGDRIGIMANGQLKCLGTSLFLKQKFGTGYKLTMVKAKKTKNKLVGPFLEKYLGKVELLSEVSSEIQFQVSQEASLNFKSFFETFDQCLPSLEVLSYGVSITTLEDVFQKVNKEFQIDISKGALPDNRESIEVSQLTKSLTESFNQPQMIEPLNNLNYDLNRTNSEISVDLLLDDEKQANDEEPKRLVGNSVALISLKALLIKRLNIYKRDRVGLCCEIIVPFIMVLVGCFLTKISFVNLSKPLNINPNSYPSPQRLLMNNQNPNQTGQYDISPQMLFDQLPDSGSTFQVSYINTTLEAHDFYVDVYNQQFVGATLPYRYGTYETYYADLISQTYQFSTFVNLTSAQSSNFFPQFMYESIIRTATNNPQFNFELTTVPFPTLYVLEQQSSKGKSFEYALMVALGIALIPSVMMNFILKEREDSVKHMQIISGMSLLHYWFSNFLADMIKLYIPLLIIYILSIIFGTNYPGAAILLFILPFALVPFTYASSFLFKDDTTAQISTIFVNVLIGGVMAVTVFFLQMIPDTFALGDTLRWVFCIIPNYCVINGILWSASGTEIIKVRQTDSSYPQISPDLWAWQNLGGDVACLLIHFFIDTLLLIMIESDFLSCLNSYSFRKIPSPDETLILDEDVQEEEIRVADENCSDVVQVNGLRKVYTSIVAKPFLAVERISFALDYGECFALLGVNGAGKSTTFKSLTADANVTQGQITVAGYNIQTQFQEARKLIGYCPQKDAIFPLMSVEEHLQFYAKIKGIPLDLHKDIIEVAIKELNLSDHRLKPAGTLSGGNKRKLSVAIAIMGNPPIILLDEPSAGMDPEARRFMWKVVSNISQRDKKSAVILTTHSMEEAEALSTKMGIMVRGGIFKCFGSSQHIKNKFGTGFEVEIKIRKPESKELEKVLSQCGIQSLLDDRIDLDQAIFITRKSDLDQFITDQISEKGIGSSLYMEAYQGTTTVRVKNFVTYVYIVQMGLRAIKLLAQSFSEVLLIEQFSDFFKFRIPRQDKTIGWLFGLIEESKNDFHVSEYGVSQTSLEQIFQSFANQSINDRLNLAFQLDKDQQLQLVKKRTLSQYSVNSNA